MVDLSIAMLVITRGYMKSHETTKIVLFGMKSDELRDEPT